MPVSNPLAAGGGILITMHSLSQGGGDRIAVTLASGFARAGIPTRIALMSNAGDGEEALRFLLHPDVVIAICGAPLRGPVSRVRERLRGVRFIREQIGSMRPGIVLAATDNMALATALACQRAAPKPILAQKLTNRLFRPNLGPFRRVYRTRLFKFIFARVDLVITLTEGEREDALRHYPELKGRVRTLPNPHLSDDMFVGSLPPRPGPPRLLTAGRMVPQKRYDLLLRALAMSTHSNAHLTIFGEGPLRPQLESLTRSLGISQRVEMPGFVADIMPALRQSSLVVLSSDYEGLPGILVRALACNVPVVTTDSFFAAHELLGAAPNCAVVPPGNAEALAQAIDRCLDAPRSDDLQSIVEPYRIETSVDAYIGALSELVEARRATAAS